MSVTSYHPIGALVTRCSHAMACMCCRDAAGHASGVPRRLCSCFLLTLMWRAAMPSRPISVYSSMAFRRLAADSAVQCSQHQRKAGRRS